MTTVHSQGSQVYNSPNKQHCDKSAIVQETRTIELLPGVVNFVTKLTHSILTMFQEQNENVNYKIKSSLTGILTK